MRRRPLRSLRPVVERVEPRVLLALYTDLMMARKQPSIPPLVLPGSNSANISGFAPSTTSVATPQNQGPQGTNLALTPTGTLSPQQQQREQFIALYKGPYTIGTGRTDTEALTTYIRGAGPSNTMRHSDIQLLIVTPKDPTVPLGAVSAIFDRNLNSNTVLGFDSSTPQLDANGQRINVDAAGRPNHLSQLSIDVNESSGVYDEAFAQGVMDIRYFPSKTHTPGVISQGTAVVKVRAQIYGPHVDFILRNSDINP